MSKSRVLAIVFGALSAVLLACCITLLVFLETKRSECDTTKAQLTSTTETYKRLYNGYSERGEEIEQLQKTVEEKREDYLQLYEAYKEATDKYDLISQHQPPDMLTITIEGIVRLT